MKPSSRDYQLRLFHETIKSGLSTEAGIAAELRGDPKRQHQKLL